jgi:N-acetylmuramoyl-L-alanine amidase
MQAIGSTVLAALMALAILTAGSAPAGATVQFPGVPMKAGLRATETPYAGGTYADTSFEDVPYVSAEFLADLFGQSTRWDPQAQQLHVQGGGKREWVFTLDNPFVSVQGAVYNLTYPARRGPERIYVPLHTVLRLLKAHFDLDLRPVGATAFSPDGQSAPLAVPPASVAVAPVGVGATATPSLSASDPDLVTDLKLEESDAGTILRIRSAPGIRWQGIRSGPHYILRAFEARLAPDFPRKIRGSASSRLTAVDAIQEPSVAQLTVRLRDPADTVELLPEAGSTGWRVSIRPLEQPASLKRKGTIIVDAGHGGHDFGAIVKGVHEADITLAVSHLLENELQAMGYTVRLTRPEDIFKTLPERPRFASENNGDVFVSLHCNSLAGSPERLAGVTGYVAYILREGESEEDKAIARRENQAIEQSGKKKAAEISPLDWIVLEHQLNLYSKQSEALAESIIRNFSGFDIPRYSTGARQAGFFVLVGAYMPAVLFEMGFLTHERDRRVLSSPDGQREIARRMAKAIDAFQRSRG